MGSSSQQGNQVTKTEPPSYQLPFLQEGLGYARGLFAEGGPQQYGGNTVVPFAPQTEQALQGITARATSGSPVTSAAQNFVTRGLNTPVSSQFGGASNPYLDATFKRAADQSYNTLTSQFARAGRNVNAAAPVQGDMLSSLASQIYAPAYENERNRQLQDLTSQRQQQGNLLAYASPLAEADYRDLAALQGVGGQVEDLTGRVIQDQARRWDYEQNRPGMVLDNYLQRISGNMGTTQTTPIYRNQTAGALGGALGGAQMGSYWGPWGTAIGAIGGGLLGAYG